MIRPINHAFWKHHGTNEQKITEKETSGLEENRVFPFYYRMPLFCVLCGQLLIGKDACNM